MVGNLHAEAFATTCDGLADAAQADDAQRLAPDLGGQGCGPLRPSAFAHEPVLPDRAADGRQNQGPRGIGHALGQHIRRVRDRDASCASRRRVDAVVAHAERRDELQAWNLRQQGIRHAVVATRCHGGDARLGHLPQQGLLVLRQVVAVQGVPVLQQRHRRRVQRPHQEKLGFQAQLPVKRMPGAGRPMCRWRPRASCGCLPTRSRSEILPRVLGLSEKRGGTCRLAESKVCVGHRADGDAVVYVADAADDAPLTVQR